MDILSGTKYNTGPALVKTLKQWSTKGKKNKIDKWLCYVCKDQSWESGIVWPTSSCKRCCPYSIHDRMRIDTPLRIRLGPHEKAKKSNKNQTYATRDCVLKITGLSTNINNISKEKGWPDPNQIFHHSSCSIFYLQPESAQILHHSKLHKLRNPMMYTSPKFKSEEAARSQVNCLQI